MRIWVFGAMALVIGASLGAISTRLEYANLGESFEVHGTVSESVSTDAPPSELVIVDGDTKDFGLVRYDSEHPHVFVIRNSGQAPLRVTKENVSCSLCVITKFTSAVVPPGETLNIDVTLQARKLGPKINESLELRTSDPSHRTVSLQLMAYVGAVARLSAEGLPLGSIDALKETTASCQIHGYFSSQIEIVQSEFIHATMREYFDFEIKQLDIADMPEKDPYVRSAYELTVRVKPGVPVGPFRQTLKLLARVEGQEDTMLELPIQGRVDGAISFIASPEFSPQYGFLQGGRVASAEGKTWEMHVMVKGPQHQDVELTIDAIEPKECLTASLGEPKALGDNITLHPLTVSVPKGAPAIARLGNEQGDAGQVVIKTTHPTAKKLILSVRFAVE
ncbi:MAG: hypothetical protein CMJ64_05455 [Planctomycetaceae bacterium]|nr:hypothetical protein [Planctomycetaceae bacterium]